MFEASAALNEMAMAVLDGAVIKDNPCYKDELGKPRIKYNGMMVELTDGKIIIYFTWNGEPMLRDVMPVGVGQTVVVSGVEGTMGLDIVS